MRINTKKKILFMTECAGIVALSVLCSFIKVWEMPQGGSVSLVMVPLFVMAYRRGAGAGMVTGVIYGAISMIYAGVIYHPLSILLDYLLAFGLVGIAGFFKKNTLGIILGTTVGVTGRFLSSLVSGAVLFAEAAPEGQNPWVYSLGYQATYLIPELFIAVVVMLLIYKKANRLINA